MEDVVVVGTVRLTQKDLAGALCEMSWFFRLRWVLVLSIVVVAGTWVVAGLTAASSQAPAQPPVAALVFAAFFAAATFLGPRMTARRIIRALAQAGDPEVTYRFDDEGVTIRATGSTTTFAYRRILKTREGKTAFFIYCSPMVANIVPKGAFAPADVDRVRALIAAHVTPKPMGAGGRKVIILWVVLIVLFAVVWLLLNAQGRSGA
jgi:hypothetical protein